MLLVGKIHRPVKGVLLKPTSVKPGGPSCRLGGLGSASTPTLRHQWQLEILNLRCQETEPKNAGFVDIATSTRGP